MVTILDGSSEHGAHILSMYFFFLYRLFYIKNGQHILSYQSDSNDFIIQKQTVLCLIGIFLCISRLALTLAVSSLRYFQILGWRGRGFPFSAPGLQSSSYTCVELIVVMTLGLHARRISLLGKQ